MRLLDHGRTTAAIGLRDGANPFADLAALASRIRPGHPVTLVFEESDAAVLGDPFVLDALLARTGFRSVQTHRLRNGATTGALIVDAVRA